MDWHVFPCVIKPTDSQGQRGVDFITDQNSLKKSASIAIENSVSRTAIVEEYLSGTEVSTNVIVQNGNLIVNEFTERLVHGIEYFGLPRGHSIPVRNVAYKTIEEATHLVELLVQKLSIKDAILYIQMVVTDKGPRIVEVAPRLDGCHIWRLLKIAKGYDLREYAINVLTGKSIRHQHQTADEEGNFTLKFHQLKSGKKFLVRDFEVKPDFLFNEFRYKNNEDVIAINGSLEVVGYYIENS